MKKYWIIILIFLVLLSGVLSYFYMDIRMYSEMPASNDQTHKIVTIHKGQRFKSTAERLYEADIVTNPFKLVVLARVKGYDKKIKAGEYLFSPSMSPNEILGRLISGKVQVYKVVVPEGYNMYQIASIVSKAGLGSEKKFLEAAKDASFVKEKKINAETFEGYLFPDTYFFPKGVTPKKIISSMTDQFWTVFTPEWKKQASTLGFSVHEAVTFASIIEKETGAAFERPLISSVFHNRLKKKMRLYSDPTVIYGIKDFDGNITKTHLKTETPYNTYKIKGLPPGPIANPGADALKAALYPAATRFLYFVSKNDKTHKFSTNLKDHNRAVRKYQRRRK